MRLTNSKRSQLLTAASAAVLVAGALSSSVAFANPGTNVRVTRDQAGTYFSAHTLAGRGAYTDAVLTRCGTDRRQQNEPTIALDPRNTDVRTAGSNDYCGIPTNGDAWAGIYRSTDGGIAWKDSLLPGYALDTSLEGTSSPLHPIAVGGAFAAGDPVQAWDHNGNLFFMGNNFNRGNPDGSSFRTRNDTGDIWVATYAPLNSADNTTDGQAYLRTVLLDTNTFGVGQGTDKTGIGVDTTGGAHDGNVYAAWSTFHGSGCNEIDFARSTDHGATFSAPMKLSSGICSNQGPNFAIASDGTVYASWQGNLGGSFSQGPFSANGAVFTKSTDGGQSFSMARIVINYAPFVSENFSGNGARQCGDGPFACPNGQTFPRFDLAQPSLTTDGTDVDMAFQVRLSSGQGQIQFSRSTNGGATWSTPKPIDPHPGDGHQFFPWISASGGQINAVYYDSMGDSNYRATRAPCNSATGAGSACLNVRYAKSTNHGATWTSIQLTDVGAATNPNFEQFGGRRVPFFGDYIMVSAVGSTVAAAWTDSRDVVPGTENAGQDMDNDDIVGDPETTVTCTGIASICFDQGGLDQNIYTQSIS